MKISNKKISNKKHIHVEETSTNVLEKFPDNNDTKKLFDFYVEISKRKKTVLNEQRKKKINARLKEYSFDDIRMAWSSMAADSFLRGGNSGGKDYFSIEYATRPEKIEHYLNFFLSHSNNAS